MCNGTGSTTRRRWCAPPRCEAYRRTTPCCSVNGKRRHRSGVLALLGSSLNTGSQGPDLSVIPTIAIKQIELLRDGASAQYGSDAIAGVLNFLLKDASEGISVEARYGEYFEGNDGETLQIAGNIGLPLTEAGFLNLSLEYRDAEPTVRSGTRANAAELIRPGLSRSGPRTDLGQPRSGQRVELLCQRWDRTRWRG